MVHDIFLYPHYISREALEIMAVEIEAESISDGGFVVVDEPPALLKLPFAPGEGLRFVACEGFEEGVLNASR